MPLSRMELELVCSLTHLSVHNPLGPDFDHFLYAQVGENHQGGPLSVVSALARVGVDPWEQAAVLARMPVESAGRALSLLLARLPAGSGQTLDPCSLATHLVTLLPRGLRQPEPTPPFAARPGNHTDGDARRGWRIALYCVICILALVGMSAKSPGAAMRAQGSFLSAP